MSVLAIIGVVLIGFVLALLAVLALPWRIDAHAALAPRPESSVRLSFWAGVLPGFRVYDSTKKKPKPKKPEKEEKARKTSKRPSGGVGFVKALPRLFLDLLSKFRIRSVQGRVRIGLSDPAATGSVFGVLSGLSHAVAPATGTVLVVQPDFDGPALELEGDAVVDIGPLSLAGPLLSFAWGQFGPGRSA